MADLIKLVKNDNRPLITLTLTDETSGAVIDLSDASTTVSVKFRKTGTTTLLATISCTKVTDGSDGQVQFKFADATLNVDPGNYEGEIEIDFDGEKQTVYDVLKFKVRDEF